LQEVGIGAIVGVVLVAAASLWIGFCARKGWISETWMQVPVAALAVGCFVTAQTLHGSGFIAAFVGGLVFGQLASNSFYTAAKTQLPKRFKAALPPLLSVL